MQRLQLSHAVVWWLRGLRVELEAAALGEEAGGELGLGVERAADADHVGLASGEDLGGLLRGPDPADGEHGDRDSGLDRGEHVAVPHRLERVLRDAIPHAGEHDAARRRLPVALSRRLRRRGVLERLRREVAAADRAVGQGVGDDRG
jgi:hypothetical protein